MELTPAELTILGLIVEQPRHGYDLERVIEQRGIRQWTDVGFSSIYYLLGRLQRRGLVRASTTGDKRSRRVYASTPAGRAAGVRATRAAIEDPAPPRLPVLVGLANLALLSDEEYAAALQHRLGQLDRRLAELTAAERAQQPLPLPAREVFSLSIHLLEAERSWIATHTAKG